MVLMDMVKQQKLCSLTSNFAVSRKKFPETLFPSIDPYVYMVHNRNFAPLNVWSIAYHTMSLLWCPSPDHYPGSELASGSLTLMYSMCWALNRAAVSQILMSFVWHGQESTMWTLNPTAHGSFNKPTYDKCVYMNCLEISMQRLIQQCGKVK